MLSVISLLVILLSIKLLVEKNGVYSAIELVLIFVLVGLRSIYLEVTVFGMMLILVYVGGVILFIVFIVMMIDSRRELGLLGVEGGLGVLWLLLGWLGYLGFEDGIERENLEMSSLNMISEVKEIVKWGERMFNEESIEVVMLGVLLLLVLIGSLGLVL